jgi:hypothetical protein
LRFLVDAVRQVALRPTDWSRIDGNLLVAAARLHRCAPATYLRARDDRSAPDDVLSALRADHTDQVVRHLRTLADLKWTSGLLNAAGVRWAVLKGPVLAERLWPRPDMRSYRDLDILVDPHDFGDVVEILETGGARLVDLNWRFIHEQMRSQVSMLLPFGTPLDLHWHVVNAPRLRQVFTFDTAECLRRTVSADLEGLDADTLDPVDTLLHLAYHQVHSGAHRLVWCKDMDAAVGAPRLDWELVRARARNFGCQLALAAALQQSRVVLSTALSEDVLPRQWWLTATRLAGAFRPVPGVPGTRFSGQIAFTNIRGTSGATALAAARDLFHHRRVHDRHAPSPLHSSIGGPSARRNYLQAVRRDSDSRRPRTAPKFGGIR